MQTKKFAFSFWLKCLISRLWCNVYLKAPPVSPILQHTLSTNRKTNTTHQIRGIQDMTKATKITRVKNATKMELTQEAKKNSKNKHKHFLCGFAQMVNTLQFIASLFCTYEYTYYCYYQYYFYYYYYYCYQVYIKYYFYKYMIQLNSPNFTSAWFTKTTTQVM